MARKGALHTAKRLKNNSTSFQEITIGEVVSNDDPQQMGRIRVLCPFFGDSEDDPIESIPLATFVSPLAGTTFSPPRGREEVQSAGQVAYGMFNIPKIGSSVLVACIDSDPKFRIWIGCVNDQFFTHTLPHGRYSYKTANKPEGPFTSSEDKLQPLYDSQTDAFTNTDTGVDARMSYEFRTRAADTSVAGLPENYTNTDDSVISHMSDDEAVEYAEPDGNTIKNTQGYPQSRFQSDIIDSKTKEHIKDPQTYSWTTPGFHSMSMQDNADNCRVRFRTTHGHQIIMDDTNERIYISTAGGKTWIEMDEVGNIDVYGERNISVHAKKDINFTADGTFRVNAGGIHMSSIGEFRMHSAEDLHIKSDTGMFLHSTADSSIKVAGGTMFIETSMDLDMKADGEFIADGASKANLSSAGNVLLQGEAVHFNGPPATTGTGVPDENTKDSYLVSRVPDHEPWARTIMKPADSDKDVGSIQTPEFTYDSPDVGRKENGEDLGRNPKWHR